MAGIAVNCLGHNHPALVKAISEQAARIIHVSNLYHVQEQADLGEAIASIVPSPLGVLMFGNSGAEANEAALKLAVKDTGREKFVACHNSFHGRTAGALSATGQEKYQNGFEPLLSQAFDFVPFNDRGAEDRGDEGTPPRSCWSRSRAREGCFRPPRSSSGPCATYARTPGR